MWNPLENPTLVFATAPCSLQFERTILTDEFLGFKYTSINYTSHKLSPLLLPGRDSLLFFLVCQGRMLQHGIRDLNQASSGNAHLETLPCKHPKGKNAIYVTSHQHLRDSSSNEGQRVHEGSKKGIALGRNQTTTPCYQTQMGRRNIKPRGHLG